MSTKYLTRKPFDLWNQNDSDAFTRRLAFFCAQKAGRFSETLCNLVSSDRKDLLCDFDIDYLYSDSATELSYARQTLAFYSKDADLETAVCWENFWLSFKTTERQCSTTNRRISSLFQSDELFTCADGIFYDVQRKITEILGEAPTLSMLDVAFGPGINVGLNNNEEASPRFKMDCLPTCSGSLADQVVPGALETLPHYLGAHKARFAVVKGKLGSVPKNAKTRRSVIVEPILNGFFQKGVGSLMKSLLLRFGCNLFDQTNNQRLAREGSIDGELVTIDLSNASNTVALMLVYHLMSEDWFSLLDQLRTSQIEYNGANIDLEMFSSMGNGFTFELESLIFYAIALVVAAKVGRETGFPIDITKISVFGDDIIVPRRMDREMRLVLELFGFTINVKKSFSQGPFRESCGADYFLGINIRPFYKKDRWTNARVVGLLNHDFARNDLFAELREELIVFCYDNDFSFGPPGLGDGHIHTLETREPYLPPYKIPSVLTKKQEHRKGSRDGYYIETFIKIQKKSYEDAPIGDSVLPLYNIYRAPPLQKINRVNEAWRIAYDVYGLSHIVRWDRDAECYSAVPPDICGSSFEADSSDPYTVRGGYKSKKVKVYMFNGS